MIWVTKCPFLFFAHYLLSPIWGLLRMQQTPTLCKPNFTKNWNMRFCDNFCYALFQFVHFCDGICYTFFLFWSRASSGHKLLDFLCFCRYSSHLSNFHLAFATVLSWRPLNSSATKLWFLNLKRRKEHEREYCWNLVLFLCPSSCWSYLGSARRCDGHNTAS